MIPTIKVELVVDNSAMLKVALKELTRADLLVGFPDEKATSRTDTPMTNAALAYINDRGSPAQNIPPRPFLEPGVRSVLPEIEAQFRQGATEAIEGNPAAVVQHMNAAGLIAQGGVREYMTRAAFTPLAPYTLVRRRARGFMGTKPLIETGQLRAAVNYVVRPRRNT